MPLLTPPVAKAQLLIRRPIAEVFRAFVDPEITSKFWFSRGSGPLKLGTTVQWYWDMYGFTVDVTVKEFEPERRILIEWPTSAEWLFTEYGKTATFVQITSSGFPGTDEEQVTQAIDMMGGFNLVLAGCKAFLEHSVQLNLVADHSPGALVSGEA